MIIAIAMQVEKDQEVVIVNEISVTQRENVIITMPCYASKLSVSVITDLSTRHKVKRLATCNTTSSNTTSSNTTYPEHCHNIFVGFTINFDIVDGKQSVACFQAAVPVSYTIRNDCCHKNTRIFLLWKVGVDQQLAVRAIFP